MVLEVEEINDGRGTLAPMGMELEGRGIEAESGEEVERRGG
jgi:hypothetical protein